MKKYIISSDILIIKTIIFANSFDEALASARKINKNFNSGHIANDDEKFNEPFHKLI